MKTFTFEKIFLILFAFGAVLLSGCSETIDDFIIGDEVAKERWDGTGKPKWMREKAFNISMERGWSLDSQENLTLWKVYCFTYKGQLLVYMHFDNFRHKVFESGGYCYTSDGRLVDFKKVDNKFEETKRLIYTNQMGGEGSVPQIAELDFDGKEKYPWMQAELDRICEEVDKAGNFMTRIWISAGKEHIVIAYDSCPYAFESIRNEKFYSLDGEQISKPDDSALVYENLCYIRLDYLDVPQSEH